MSRTPSGRVVGAGTAVPAPTAGRFPWRDWFGRCGRTRGQRGAVTAETVMVMPVLVAVMLGLTWLLLLAVTQVRVVDAAREAARSAARGETEQVSRTRARQVAPGGARIVIRRTTDLVTVIVGVDLTGPGGLVDFLPPVSVTSTAVAATEPGGPA